MDEQRFEQLEWDVAQRRFIVTGIYQFPFVLRLFINLKTACSPPV
jgi:hypothetical protein